MTVAQTGSLPGLQVSGGHASASCRCFLSKVGLLFPEPFSLCGRTDLPSDNGFVYRPPVLHLAFLSLLCIFVWHYQRKNILLSGFSKYAGCMLTSSSKFSLPKLTNAFVCILWFSVFVWLSSMKIAQPSSSNKDILTYLCACQNRCWILVWPCQLSEPGGPSLCFEINTLSWHQISLSCIVLWLWIVRAQEKWSPVTGEMWGHRQFVGFSFKVHIRRCNLYK